MADWCPVCKGSKYFSDYTPPSQGGGPLGRTLHSVCWYCHGKWDEPDKPKAADADPTE